MALENIGGAWLKEKNGKKFMSISLDAEKLQSTEGKINMLMYKNDYKEKDNQPDYKLFQIQEEQQQPRQEPEQQVEDINSEIPF